MAMASDGHWSISQVETLIKKWPVSQMETFIIQMLNTPRRNID
jgi:hypothetical protein